MSFGEGIEKAAGEDGIPVPPKPLATINLRLPIALLAREIGELIRSESIFRRGEGEAAQVVTVAKDGATLTMNRDYFPVWLASYAITGEEDSKGNWRNKDLTDQATRRILAALARGKELRPLNGVQTVRLPVWTTEERKGVELAPIGYHEHTGILTVESLSYDAGRYAGDPDAALDFLLDLLRGFPWSEEGDNLREHRSVAVQLAAMLGVFCRLLFEPGETKPGILYFGNQPGTGKTILATLALAPVFGRISAMGMAARNNEAETEKRIDSKVIQGAPYVFLDNVTGSLKCDALDRAITSQRYEARTLSKSETLNALNQWQVFITANNAIASKDQSRRLLIVDLFAPGDPLERRHSRELSSSVISSPSMRADILAALSAIVMEWAAQGCPLWDKSSLASFENYGRVVGGIVAMLGLADPFQKPPESIALNPREAAFRDLILAMAEDITGESKTRAFATGDYVDKAETLGIDGELFRGAKKPENSFGWLARDFGGRVWKDPAKGRSVQFGDRHKRSAGAEYPVTILA